MTNLRLGVYSPNLCSTSVHPILEMQSQSSVGAQHYHALFAVGHRSDSIMNQSN